MLKMQFLWDTMPCCWMSDPDVPKGCIAFIFKGSRRQCNPSNCFTDQLARQCSSRPLVGPEPALGISTMIGSEVMRGWMNMKTA
jgi:hypothetical protein